MHLRKLNKLDEQEVLALVKEFKSEETTHPFEGIDDFGRFTNYDDFLKLLEMYTHIEDYKPNYVSQTAYGLFDESNTLYGIINIRCKLVPKLLRRGGNIGYAIRPSKRGKGYGKLLLNLGLKKAKETNINKDTEYDSKVLVTCRKDNTASANTILSNGGVIFKEQYLEETKEVEQYYWINI